MDRPLIYPGAIPAETDTLWVAKNCMVGLGMLFEDLIGTQTLAASLPCTPGSGLNVSIGAGRIYSLQEIDATPYSSIAADTHTVVKQGFLKDPSVLACPAPGTAGQSINYLIEATYADVDTNLVTLPYFNAANQLEAYSGPGNNGAAQATVRSSELQLQIKAGTAAATGSQTTPAADAGYIGLYVVTVANGASSIVSGNIAQITANFLPQGPYMSASAGPYATEAELAAAVAPLATSAAVASDIAPLATSAALSSAIAPLATSAALASAVASLATSASVAAALAAAEAFAAGTTTINANGWAWKMPNGWIFQCGLITLTAGDTAYPGTFPIDFPTQVFGVSIACMGSYVQVTAASDTLSSFVAQTYLGDGPTTGFWMALGK